MTGGCTPLPLTVGQGSLGSCASPFLIFEMLLPLMYPAIDRRLDMAGMAFGSFLSPTSLTWWCHALQERTLLSGGMDSSELRKAYHDGPWFQVNWPVVRPVIL